MAAKTRRSLIERRIMTGGELDFASLAREFGVSEMTIRRDIDALVARGLVRRVVGGAIAVSPSKVRATESVDSDTAATRRDLAECVVDEFSEGDSVILTPGPISRSIAELVASRSLKLSVVTADVRAALALVEDDRSRVFLTGGRLSRRDYSVTGNSVAESFAAFHCDVLVLDSVAVHGKRGVSADEPETARDLMAAVSAAGRTVVVADFDALDRVAFAHVCDLRDVDTLAIAASAEDTTAVTEARRLGIEVLTAPARDAS